MTPNTPTGWNRNRRKDLKKKKLGDLLLQVFKQDQALNSLELALVSNLR